MLSALSVLPVLPDDLSDDIDDQHVHDHPDPDEGRKQGKGLRESVRETEGQHLSPKRISPRWTARRVLASARAAR